MDEKTRRPLTWVIILVVIAAIIATAIYRRTEMDRLANAIAYGSPSQRVAAVSTLIQKQKLMEALEDRPRWVMDNAVSAIGLIDDTDAYYELLTCHGVLDAPVQARDQALLTGLGRRGVETFLEAIQDKDGTTRGTAKAPLINIGKSIGGEGLNAGNPVIDGCMDLIDAWDGYVRDLCRDILAGIAVPAVTAELVPVMQQTEPGRKTLPDGTDRDETTQEYMRKRATAEATLLLMKIPAIQPIIDNLLTYNNPEDDKSPDIRGNAARMLGIIADQTLAAPIAADEAAKVVQPLLDRLNKDPHWAVQRRAATALGLLGQVAIDNGVVPQLIAHLSDRPEVKAAAVEGLGRIGSPEAIIPLVQTLITNRRGATSELRIALTALGDEAIPAITTALSDPQIEVRLIATQAIAEIGGENAVVPLGRMLQDPDLTVRRVSSDALRAIADERVLPQVAAALGDSDWQVYHAARDALANVGEPAIPVLVNALGSSNPRVCSMAREALVRIGDPALPALRNALASAEATRAHWAAIAIGEIGPSGVKPALAVLRNASEPTTARAQAALALGRTGAGDAVEPLLAALKTQEPAVKIRAIKALDRLADERATPGLVEALESKSYDVRDIAMDVLREWRLGDVDVELKKVVQSGDTNAKRRAAILLAEYTSVATHELLEDIVDLGKQGEQKEAPIDVTVLEQAALDTSETAKVRTRAIHALGYVGSEANLKPLESLMKPGNQFAAVAAVAVAKIGTRFAKKVKLGAREEATQAATVLVELMLTTDDDQLRAKVAAGLSAMGGQPVWSLIEKLKSSDDEVRMWIIATLGAIGKPASEPVLEERGDTDDPNMKAWLTAALPLIGDAQALDLVANLGKEDQPDPKKYEPAEKLLEKIRAVRVL